jgi:2-oxo-4-hydroxy-4-carboxy-5-ureidoimidazoline decarboxylase
MAATIAELDAMSEAELVNELSPLFEGAPAFLGRLAAARPFGAWSALWTTAERVASTMPEADQVELLDAHPRLGAPPGSMSAMSYVEQGYDREAADAAAEQERRRVDAELARLNEVYEATFGFRYCVFVAGRPRAALIDDFAAALRLDRDAELRRGLVDVVRIAQDRHRKRAGEG